MHFAARPWQEPPHHPYGTGQGTGSWVQPWQSLSLGEICRSQPRACAESQCYSQERRQRCFQCVSFAVLPPSLLRAPHHHFYSTADNSLPYFLSLRTLCSKRRQELPGIQTEGSHRFPLRAVSPLFTCFFPVQSAKYSRGQRQICPLGSWAFYGKSIKSSNLSKLCCRASCGVIAVLWQRPPR